MGPPGRKGPDGLKVRVKPHLSPQSGNFEWPHIELQCTVTPRYFWLAYQQIVIAALLRPKCLVSFPRIPFPETMNLRIRGFPARKESCKTCHWDRSWNINMFNDNYTFSSTREKIDVWPRDDLGTFFPSATDGKIVSVDPNTIRRT